MVKMIATPKRGTLKYGTRRLMAGDEFEVPDTKRGHARILEATRKARRAPAVEAPRRGRSLRAAQPEPEPEPEVPVAAPAPADPRRDELIQRLEGGATTDEDDTA